MPNHILNVISIDSDDKQQREQGILSILDNQGVFDFNRYIPMPRILRNTQAPNRINPDECRNKTGYMIGMNGLGIIGIQSGMLTIKISNMTG
ncbi:TPA: hypothetical protein ACX6RM_002304 [Photobacterium damselae]